MYNNIYSTKPSYSFAVRSAMILAILWIATDISFPTSSTCCGTGGGVVVDAFSSSSISRHSRGKYEPTMAISTSPIMKSSSTPSRTSTSLRLLGSQHHRAAAALEDHSVTLAGSLWPVIQKFQIGPMKLREIFHSIQLITEWQEIIILPAVAFLFHPIMKYIIVTNLRRRITNAAVAAAEDDTMMDMDEIVEKEMKHDLKKIRKDEMSWYNLSYRIGEIGKVAFSVYVVDVISITLTTLGFTFPKTIQLSASYAKIACT